MQEREKPDAIVLVNDFDVTLYRRGRGLEIRVEKSGFEVGMFRLFAGMTLQQPETPPAVPSKQPEIPTTPSPTSEPVSSDAKKELPQQPVKIDGTIEAIEGLGQTPNTGDPVFRFSVRTEQEEVKQIAAFRQIAQALDQLTKSTDPNIKLIPGRQISMMAWDHSAKTGSYYPSSINYLNLPPITNPKNPKRQ